MDKKHTNRATIKQTILLTFILQFCFTGLVYAEYPPDYKATYDVDKLGVTVGRSTISLLQNEQEIHYSQNVILVGIASWFKKDRVSENSWLTKNDDDTYLLKKYQYTHTHSKKNRDSLLEAKWTKQNNNQLTGSIIGNSRGKTVSLHTDKKLWDTLSFQLALMSDVSNNSDTYQYDVISRGKLKNYAFTKMDEEAIEVNDVQYQTIRVERRNGEKLSKIWLAEGLHYIPVLIEKYKDDELDSRMTLNSIAFTKINTETAQPND